MTAKIYSCPKCGIHLRTKCGVGEVTAKDVGAMKEVVLTVEGVRKVNFVCEYEGCP